MTRSRDPLPEQTSRFEIGDSFDLIHNIPDEALDLIITSPPYWGMRTYGANHNWDILDDWKRINDQWCVPSYAWYRENGGVLGLEPMPHWYIMHLVEFFNLCWNKIKPNGNVWVNMGDTFFARWSSIRDSGRQGLGKTSRERRKTPMGKYLQEKQLLQIPARFAMEMQNNK